MTVLKHWPAIAATAALLLAGYIWLRIFYPLPFLPPLRNEGGTVLREIPYPSGVRFTLPCGHPVLRYTPGMYPRVYTCDHGHRFISNGGDEMTPYNAYSFP